MSVFLHQNAISISTGTFSVLLTTESPLRRTMSVHRRHFIKILNKEIRIVSSNNNERKKTLDYTAKKLARKNGI